MENRNLDVSVLLPNLAALLFVAIGLVTQRSALVSERPYHPAAEAYSTSMLKTEARLWEDPLKSVPKLPTERPPKNFFEQVVRSVQPAPPSNFGVDEFRASVCATQAETWETRRKRRKADGAGTHVAAESSTLFLPVMINSDSYAEAREQRLRARYAVLSALGRAQYISEDDGHLNFAFVDLQDGGERICVPYEIFTVRAAIADRVAMPGHPSEWSRPDGTAERVEGPSENVLRILNAYDQVVVLWVDENRLVREPQNSRVRDKAVALGKDCEEKHGGIDSAKDTPSSRPTSDAKARGQSHLLENIDLLIRKLICGVSANSEVKIIGPTNSDHLELILKTASENTFCPTVKLEKPVRMLCARATASDDIFAFAHSHKTNFFPPDVEEKSDSHAANTKGHGSVELTSVGGKSTWLLERTIASDEKLVRQILEELNLRNASPLSSPKNHIAIVAEWDSLYARSMSRTFAHELSFAADLKKSTTSQTDETLTYQARRQWLTSPDNIHEFSYLRGMDGQSGTTRTFASSLDGPPPEEEKAHQKEKSAETKSGLERPDGEWQFDYLRRLGEELYYLDTKIQRDNKGRLTAIGVLGSDIYDKLLVLRALRSQFPSVIFFTTDLDALYLDPQESRWTRNLVVASAQGLAAADIFQDRIPPFRDSYQTALFLTTLRALNVDRLKRMQLAEAAPSVFEIGRSEAHRLNEPRKKGNITAPPRRVSHIESPITLLILALIIISGAISFFLLRSRLFFVQFVKLFLLLGALPGTWCGLMGTFIFVLIAAKTGVAGTRTILWPLLAIYSGTLLIVGFRSPQIFIEGKDSSILEKLKAVVIPFGWLGLAVAITSIAINLDSEERFSLFEGVSVWPTDILRSAGLITAICFLIAMRQKLLDLKQWVNVALLGGPAFEKLQATNGMSMKTPRAQKKPWKLLLHFAYLFPFQSRMEGTAVEVSEREILKQALNGRAGLERRLWVRYLRRTSSGRRNRRVAIMGTAYMALSIAISFVFGFPTVPARGVWSRLLDMGVLLTTVVAYIALLFYMVDAVSFSARMIRRFAAFIPVQESLLCETESTGIINEVVTVLTRLIYFPFTIVFILILSRNSVFDCWDWPPSLIVTFCLGLVIIVVSLIVLQSAAREAKHRSLDYINSVIMDCLWRLRKLANPKLWDAADSGHAEVPDKFYPNSADPAVNENYLRDRLEHFRERRRVTESYDGAAFQPWYRNPIFTAMLIPFTGVGSIAAIEHIVELFSKG